MIGHEHFNLLEGKVSCRYLWVLDNFSLGRFTFFKISDKDFFFMFTVRALNTVGLALMLKILLPTIDF